MVIDCHTHLDDDGTADKLLRSMDEAEIDASIIIAETLPGDISNAAQVLEAVSRSDRLWAIVNCVFSKTVELKYVEELTQLLHEERVVGLKFYLGYEEFSANDERLHQLYEYCEKQDVTIMPYRGWRVHWSSQSLAPRRRCICICVRSPCCRVEVWEF